ncbi:MAG: glutaredoxin domain-containing protein [Gemmatimonadota bacterium]
MSVVVYSTDFCGYCDRAKALLALRKIPFDEVLLSRSEEGLARLAAVAPRGRTFPQIVIHGRPIGGYAELAALDRGDELTRLVG